MNEMLNAIPPMAYAVIIIIGFCALFGTAYYALKNGMLSGEALKVGTTVLEGMQQSAQALAKATGNGAISVAAFVLDAGTRAAHAAEQMYKTGEIDKAERNKAAKEIAEELLKLAGIEVTEDRKTALAVAIEAECDAMGHTMQLSGTATVTGTEEEIRALLSKADEKTEKAEAAEEEEAQAFEPSEGSLTRGYDTPECTGDGQIYVGVSLGEGEGCGWKRVEDCTDEELHAAMKVQMPKADADSMTQEDIIAALTWLTEEN